MASLETRSEPLASDFYFVRASSLARQLKPNFEKFGGLARILVVESNGKEISLLIAYSSRNEFDLGGKKLATLKALVVVAAASSLSVLQSRYKGATQTER